MNQTIREETEIVTTVEGGRNVKEVLEEQEGVFTFAGKEVDGGSDYVLSEGMFK